MKSSKAPPASEKSPRWASRSHRSVGTASRRHQGTIEAPHSAAGSIGGSPARADAPRRVSERDRPPLAVSRHHRQEGGGAPAFLAAPPVGTGVAASTPVAAGRGSLADKIDDSRNQVDPGGVVTGDLEDRPAESKDSECEGESTAQGDRPRQAQNAAERHGTGGASGTRAVGSHPARDRSRTVEWLGPNNPMVTDLAGLGANRLC